MSREPRRPGRRRPRVERLSFLFVPVFLVACGGAPESELDVTVDDIDQESSFTVTDQELARFREPRDSALTEQQVVAYLRTSLLQFDLIREERKGLHQNLQTMERREQRGGALGQLQNMMDAGRTLYQTADLIGGSYVRSARTLGYNPAEMEWVRERVSEIAGHLMMKPMQQGAAQAAAEVRAQAQAMRAEYAGNAEMQSYIREMLEAADQMEVDARTEASGAVARNVEVLRRAKPAVTDEMWTAIGLATAASGFLALAGIDDPDNPETERQLDELRTLYQNALDNRASEAGTGLQ